MRVGIVSDTHGLLDPALPAVLDGVELVLHAGDVGDPSILPALGEIAPVLAVRGNNDAGPGLGSLPERLEAELGGLRALLLHEASPRDPQPALLRLLERGRVDLVVHGHSHRPGAVVAGGRLFLNPGSAGPRRFSLPRTACILTIRERELEARFLDLAGSRPAPFGEPFRTRL